MTNQAPTRQAEHERVYDVIDGEIEYAVSTHPQSPPLTFTEYVALIDQYAVKLATPLVPESPAHPEPTVDQAASLVRNALGVVREIAALSVRAMSAYGAIPRENHVPASAAITGVMHATSTPDKASTHHIEPGEHHASSENS